MAQQSDLQNQSDGLRYLSFFHVAAQKAISRLGRVYQYGKENSGPLKQGISAVEGTVKVLVAPIFSKIQDKPYKILAYADRKVEDAVLKIDRHAPPLLKRTASQVYETAKEAPKVARSFYDGVREQGITQKTKGVAKQLYSKTEPVARDVYYKYEPVAEHWTLVAWNKLLQFPIVPQTIETILPPGVRCVQIYNSKVQILADRQYRLASYLPIVPVEKLSVTISRSLEKRDVKASERKKENDSPVDEQSST
eukprot:TRINITY_DN809_c0_g1_i1.p1 TRINITY_DN809_c0_g1~~TRINITY_DN809_c0_g1_i1.p1  ORF type:complete len:251 (+),score=45.45 TRINITY_DN809_c0_g1_i1:115-867(+)